MFTEPLSSTVTREFCKVFPPIPSNRAIALSVELAAPTVSPAPPTVLTELAVRHILKRWVVVLSHTKPAGHVAGSDAWGRIRLVALELYCPKADPAQRKSASNRNSFLMATSLESSQQMRLTPH